MIERLRGNRKGMEIVEGVLFEIKTQPVASKEWQPNCGHNVFHPRLWSSVYGHYVESVVIVDSSDKRRRKMKRDDVEE